MHKDRLTEILALEELKVPRITVGEANPTFLPVHLTGGIGDAILAIPTLRRLLGEGCRPVVYCQHVDALRFFYARDTKGSPLPNFTWHLELNSVARFHFSTRFSGFLREDHRVLFEQQQTFFRDNTDIEWLTHQHPELKYLLTRRAAKLGLDAQTLPLRSLGFDSVGLELTPPRHQGPTDYITIHDGFDANYPITGERATKQWDLIHWHEVVRKLREVYPTLDVIQLGTKAARAIIGTTHNYVGKTTIQDALCLIARSRLHIDTDSGLAHAATALGVPCVVMFGPTPKEFYGHPQNINLSSTSSCAGSCFHLTDDWMDKCPIGYSSPRCMDDITPKMVMEAVGKLLG